MNLEHSILDAVRALPPDQQREVLKHVNELRKSALKKPRKSGRGLWADLDVSVSAEQIDDLRRELWKDS
jgi:hypothetical protein